MIRRSIFNIVIAAILIASFATINYAYAEIDVTLTPDDFIMQNHQLIIDIQPDDSPGPTDTYPINIQVINASGANLDSFQTDVNFDPSWGKYRLGIMVKTGDPIEDNRIQANHGDTIEVQYDDADPSEWPKVIFHNVPGSPLTEDRWTFSTKINCLDDQDGDPDTDGDGVCDVWEDNVNGLLIDDRDGIDPQISGSYFYNCTLTNAGGCGSDKPDIFVEIDWMESHMPDPKAIKQVVDSFDNAGIRLHLQVDPNSAHSHIWNFEFPGYDIDGYRGFDQIKAESFGTCMERDPSGNCDDQSSDWNEEKKLKHQVFHYGFYAHRMTNDAFQTGVGEIVGNDFLITLGKYTGLIGSTDQQSGTLMHELGHNLGLNHGGDEFDEVNNKPNLFSVMTYTRQFADLDSNRKLDFSNAALGHHHTSPPRDTAVSVWGLHEDEIKGYVAGMSSYSGHENEPIIFSCPDGQVAPVIYLTGQQGGVDWDCDGDSTTKGQLALNINNFSSAPTTDGERLDGNNDWDALNFAFSSNAGNYADGRHGHVASGKTQSGGDGIPFGETISTLNAKGLKPDPDYNFVPTNYEEITFEKVTLNRISNLLSLYRQIDMFDESDFKTEFSLGSNFWLTTNSMILETQSTLASEVKNDSFKQVGTSEPPEDSDNDGDGISESEDPDDTDPCNPNTSHKLCVIEKPDDDKEPKKNSFKKAVRSAINLINHHEIQKTQTAVQIIDKALKNSLSHNYDKIQPITGNLNSAYGEALGFGAVSIDDPESEPIVKESRIDSMIKDVEDFVDKTESVDIPCGVPFEIKGNECVCPSGSIENAESDCVFIPPVKQLKVLQDLEPKNVQCKIGFQLVLDIHQDPSHNRPACVNDDNVNKMVERGWEKPQN